MSQVAYKVNDVYLCREYDSYKNMKVVKILDVNQEAKAVKTDADGWVTAEWFHKTVNGKLGRLEFSWLPYPAMRIVYST